MPAPLYTACLNFTEAFSRACCNIVEIFQNNPYFVIFSRYHLRASRDVKQFDHHNY